MHACVSSVASVVSDSLGPYGLWPVRLLCPWDSPGKNIRVSCHALLQGIFPTQGLNPHLLCLLHCRWILYHLSQQGSSCMYIQTNIYNRVKKKKKLFRKKTTKLNSWLSSHTRFPQNFLFQYLASLSTQQLKPEI